jgi:hypothetical protein
MPESPTDVTLPLDTPTLPDDPEYAVPLLNTKPPLEPDDNDEPLDTQTQPLDASVTPLLNNTPPLKPLTELPLDTDTQPLAPEFDVPLLNNTLPLTPLTIAFDDAITTLPDEVTLVPLNNRNTPPVIVPSDVDPDEM